MPPRRRQRNQEAESHNENEGGPNNPMQEFVNLLTAAFNQAGGRAPAGPRVARTTTFKEFKSVGPPEFKGTTDPMEAQTWVKEIEKAFVITNVAEAQKTSFATYMMKGEANYWWEAHQGGAGAEAVTWEQFKKVFFENYFPTSMQGRMEIKFLELKQGDMTVPQYAAKFNELARFAPHQVDTEERKARRFEQGLKPWLYSRISIFQSASYGTILEKAIIAEGGGEALSQYHKERKIKSKIEGGNKAEVASGSGNLPKRKSFNPGNTGVKQGDPKRRTEACKTCGKSHMGVCLKGKAVCYNCGQEGHLSPNCPNPKKNQGCFVCGSMDHMARNCPKKGLEGNKSSGSGQLAITGPTPSVGRPSARTFNMTVQDAVASTDVVAGIIPVNEINAYVLFDLGTTCSFIACEFAK